MPMTTPLRKSLRPRRSTSKAASGFGGGYDSDSSFDPDEEQSNIYARGGGAPRSKQASLMGASVIPSATLSSTLPSQQQQQQQQLPALPGSTNSDAKEYVSEPRDTDIFSNRGRNAFRHPGNQRFREIILEFIEPYQNAKSRHEKTSTVDEAYERILDYGGRFLKKDRSNGDQWYVITAKEARTKVGHTLRDCCTDRIKSIKAARDGTAKDCGITKWASPPSSNRRKSRNRRNTDATKRKKAASTNATTTTADSNNKSTPSKETRETKQKTPRSNAKGKGKAKGGTLEISPQSVTNISAAFDSLMEEQASFHPPEIDEIESSPMPNYGRMNFPRMTEPSSSPYANNDFVTVVTNSAASSFSTDAYDDEADDDFDQQFIFENLGFAGKGDDSKVGAGFPAASSLQEECESSSHLIPVEPETTLDSSVIDMYNAIPLGDLDDYLSPDVVQNAYGYQHQQQQQQQQRNTNLTGMARARGAGGGGGASSCSKPQTSV